VRLKFINRKEAGEEMTISGRLLGPQVLLALRQTHMEYLWATPQDERFVLSFHG